MENQNIGWPEGRIGIGRRPGGRGWLYEYPAPTYNRQMDMHVRANRAEQLEGAQWGNAEQAWQGSIANWFGVPTAYEASTAGNYGQNNDWAGNEWPSTSGGECAYPCCAPTIEAPAWNPGYVEGANHPLGHETVHQPLGPAVGGEGVNAAGQLRGGARPSGPATNGSREHGATQDDRQPTSQLAGAVVDAGRQQGSRFDMCEGCGNALDHPMQRCRGFQRMGIETKKAFLKAHDRCFGCLRRHPRRRCDQPECRYCVGKYHNSRLCPVMEEKKKKERAAARADEERDARRTIQSRYYHYE